MEIKELDKKQYILLTLLITFVVSIATGIVTVSLMNQMPKSVPQTINNVIQRTIEKVTTVQVPTPVADNSKEDATDEKDSSLIFSNNDALVSIYKSDQVVNPAEITSTQDATPIDTNNSTTDQNDNVESTAIGQGIIISDIGLILVDTSILTEDTLYKVILNKTDFNASVLKKFSNGFTVLKISAITDKTDTGKTSETTKTEKTVQ